MISDHFLAKLYRTANQMIEISGHEWLEPEHALVDVTVRFSTIELVSG